MIKCLIVEDDPIGRNLISRIMQDYTSVDVAVDGNEAVALFTSAFEEGEGYGLVLLDIMMPGKSGQDVLKIIREFEEKNGILGSNAATIVMTTALDDKDNVFEAFRHQCEGYLVKPITRQKIEDQLQKLGLMN